MEKFRVWLRPLKPLDYGYEICVDGFENSRWLLTQLARSFAFGSAKPILQAPNSSLCTVQVPRNSLLSVFQFRKLLKEIPEVVFLQTGVDERTIGRTSQT